ncbi:hypothetical protein GN956_G12402 [Arapaima gigas]
MIPTAITLQLWIMEPQIMGTDFLAPGAKLRWMAAKGRRWFFPERENEVMNCWRRSEVTYAGLAALGQQCRCLQEPEPIRKTF